MQLLVRTPQDGDVALDVSASQKRAGGRCWRRIRLQGGTRDRCRSKSGKDGAAAEVCFHALDTAQVERWFTVFRFIGAGVS